MHKLYQKKIMIERERLDPDHPNSVTSTFSIPRRTEEGLEPITIEISTPFQPYPSQVLIMKLVLDALEKKSNCLIESPTVS